ncbi:hypothetical protein QCA50_007870 [Cerrena zonata]|uniref:Uncharacterized protein n=1 Tax=Cerrena zonata TaxID=2478898 RepID=A0AAW0GCV8_9APHY
MARTKSSAPRITNPVSVSGATRLSKGKSRAPAPPPPKKGRLSKRPAPSDYESEEDVPPRKYRIKAVSASPSPEPESDVERAHPQDGTSGTSHAPRRTRSESLPLHDVEPAEDDIEEEEDYGYGDHEGDNEEDEDELPEPLYDTETAARVAQNLVDALAEAKDNQRCLQPFKKAARVIPHLINPFLSIGSSIECGLRIDPDLTFEEQNFAGIKNMTESLCWEIKSFYDRISEMCPALVKAMDLFANDPAAFESLCKYMDKNANAARRDDCSRIRHHVLIYIDDIPSTLEKDERGWHNRQTARLLCPQDQLEEFDADWLRFANEVMSGVREIDENDLPSFLWDQTATDPNNPYAGLCRGPLLLKAMLP